LIAQKYDEAAHRAPGRPRTAGEIESLVVCIAEENRDWGYRRIQGARSNLGHELARSTIAQILERHGIEPAPERIRETTWKHSRHDTPDFDNDLFRNLFNYRRDAPQRRCLLHTDD
jgi:hypothetical protein